MSYEIAHPLCCILQKTETLTICKSNVCDRAREKFGSVTPEIVIVLLPLQLQRLLIQLGSHIFLK